jgi:aspartate aminotransferase-like enzyme
MLQAGQGSFNDSVLRIGHMGWVTEEDLEIALDALACAAVTLGLPVTSPAI